MLDCKASTVFDREDMVFLRCIKNTWFGSPIEVNAGGGGDANCNDGE